MYKFGGHTLCDRCRKILATNWNFLVSAPTWSTVKSKKNYRMDFCDEKCRILHCRGRKYYQRKLEHMRKNGLNVENH